MYEVRQRFQLPDLQRFLPDGGAIDRSTEQWEIRHFDTAAGDLAFAGLALTETSPADGTPSWQIAVGGRPYAETATAAGSDRSIPPQFDELLLGAARGNALRQVSHERTEELRLVLRDATGVALGSVLDQHVSGSETEGHVASLTERRTVRAQADAPGFADSIKAVNRAIVENGGRRAPSRRTSRHSTKGASSRDAASALIRYLGAQDSALISGDLALRGGDFEVVHALRVAVRRLRSTLKNFAGCFTADEVAAFDDDLRWYATVLGGVRAKQVMLERLGAAVTALPDDLVLGPVAARISQHLTAELLEGQRTLTRTLTDARYVRLLAQSARWAGGAHLRSSPAIRRAEVLDAVRRSARKADRRLRTGADDAGAGLHRAQKAVKRARHAAELARESLGHQGSRRDVKKYRRLQDLLKEHQHALAAVGLLRQWGAARGIEAGENGFTYGVLHSQELRQAERMRLRVRRLA